MRAILHFAGLMIWLLAVPAGAQTCGGVGQPACPPPAPAPAITPLVIEVVIPTCALKTPPCVTAIDVNLVPPKTAPTATPAPVPARAPAPFFAPRVPPDVQVRCDHPRTRKCPSGTLPASKR